MKKVILTFAFIAAVATLSAATLKGYSSQKTSGLYELIVDSIGYRTDLTRIYGKLKGRPHTSDRIDRLSITPTGGRMVYMTDIDGVDVKRWFQWEDDGIIEVEIDFPPMKAIKGAVIKAEGPKGTGSWTITGKAAPKARKRVK